VVDVTQISTDSYVSDNRPPLISLDDTTPMMAQYLSIKKDHLDSILFYRMGDFYEMFFEDAVKASKALDIALTKRGRYGGEDIPMCGVPVIHHENYLSKLIRSGFKVAVCEQIEDPAEAKKRGSKSVVQRAVTRLITAGTITEDNLLDSRQANYLVAIAESQGHYGFAWLDISTGEFYMQPCGEEKLGLVLTRLEAGEILVTDKFFQSSIDRVGLKEWHQFFNPLPSVRFDSDNGRKRLQALFQVMALDAFGHFSRAELAAGGALIDYVELTQKGKLPRLSYPKSVPEGAVMEIDQATRRNLELTETLSGQKQGSLLSVLDRTVTGAGARLLAQILSAPLTDRKEIENRLDSLAFFYERTNSRLECRFLLKQCPDMERALARLSLNRGGPRDLASIRDGLALLPSLMTLIYFLSDLSEYPIQLQQIKDHLEPARTANLFQDLSQSLNDTLPLTTREGGFIAKGFNSDLDHLKQLRDDSRQLIADLQVKYCEMSGITTLKIRNNNVLGFFIEVPSKQADKMGEPFIHRQTLSTASRFTTIELNELEQKIVSAGDRALSLEIEIFNQLQTLILEKAEDIAKASKALASIDMITALADLAVDHRYCRPVLCDDLSFEIKEGRHPIVELFHHDAFIANDCLLEDRQKLWLITGPNMAGKSTFLRQNALIAVMAQIGSFVPAKQAKIGIIDRLFSRVGAADDLARGRSTFMVEMVETAAILHQAGPHSLVILDEIGRGTATYDGLSIAWAVVEHLHDINKCRALFATHYHELTTLADKLNALSCYSLKVKEWDDDVIFLHEIGPGTADRSYGIHVAQLAGLPPLVTERASTILKELETGHKKQKIFQLSEDLPLFSYFKEEKKEKSKQVINSEIIEKIIAMNPDHLTPREALDILYQLKSDIKITE
jgi:DNA mismatch repair protein MutS